MTVDDSSITIDWNVVFSGEGQQFLGYEVIVNVNWVLAAEFDMEGEGFGDYDEWVISNISGRSFVNKVDGTAGVLYLGDGGWSWVGAHEFGHFVGLRDHYSDVLDPKTGRIRSLPAMGWEQNMMAAWKGRVDIRNALELLAWNSSRGKVEGNLQRFYDLYRGSALGGEDNPILMPKKAGVTILASVVCVLVLITLIVHFQRHEGTLGIQDKSFELIISRYGLPGEPSTTWTITSDGVVRIEESGLGQESRTVKTRIGHEAMQTVRQELEAFSTLVGVYESELQIHDNLGIVLKYDETTQTILLKNHATPSGVMALLRTIDSVLDDPHKIRY